MDEMKPILKWAGGKRRIAEELHSYFPIDWKAGTYIEPFFGGGAMFLYLKPEKAIVADINLRLYEFYTHIKNSYSTVFDEICLIAKSFDETETDKKKEFFLELRERYNNSPESSMESAVLLFVLNKLCFNGLYRENSKGFFNVPFGKKVSFPAILKEDFQEVSSRLQNTTILNCSFEETLMHAIPGDFVYLDPPYVPLNATSSFTDYHSNGFGLPEQIRLASKILELKEQGINAMCSNSDTPTTRDVYAGLNLRTIQASRQVSANAAGRGLVSELVITNY